MSTLNGHLITPSSESPDHLSGLTTEQANNRTLFHGKNVLEDARRNHLKESIRNIVTEPMFLLLAVACLIYFFLGDFTEAMMMVVSILFVAGIEIYQETKSERALDALRKFTRAQVRVLRDGNWVDLSSEDLVPDDIISIEEGSQIPADGELVEQHDLSVDESVLTGESLAVEKSLHAPKHLIYQGTTVVSGAGIFKATKIGAHTEIGKLGKSIESIDTSPTQLQLQIKKFVKQMGIVGGIAFAIVFVLNFSIEHDVWKALLFSLTMAMAILPEEIPVAFSAFMGLGAYRMIQHGILAKQPKTVESLGSATVICLDKTGTITENRMSVAEVTDYSGQRRTLEFALWASEPNPFDPMEKAILAHYCEEALNPIDPRSEFIMIKEYPLSGKPPMMTHVWEKPNGTRVIACKGAVERVLEVAGVKEHLTDPIIKKMEEMASKGYRVLGVASATFDGNKFPEQQHSFQWQFEGLVAFYDPPKENVADVFEKFYTAGIRVLMITGDHVATAKNIAQKTGLVGWELVITGQEVMALQDSELCDAVRRVNVYARMFPEAKLRVVNALKMNGETVAMSGDGVNDGPALKAAQIGVAMGKSGTEIAKNAASLVLLDDNLHSMVIAIAMGRRIYYNLKKAIRYVISIHLPIVLLVLIPLLLGWPYPHILLPLHVIFLELVMDPTAAIAFENEPAEPNTMSKPPRANNVSFFSWKELGISLLQGLGITIGVLFMYQYAVSLGHTEQGVRSIVFATMVFSNLFLTLANRSFDYTLIRTLFYKNNMMPILLSITIVMLLAILYVPFLSKLFQMSPISALELSKCALAGFMGVGWFEVYKAIKTKEAA